MLLAIDKGNGNPTQALMAAMAARPDAKQRPQQIKDEEFFLAFLNETGRVTEKVVKVLGGDPGKGAMSLELDEPIVKGSKVKVCPACSEESEADAPSSCTVRRRLRYRNHAWTA